MISADSRKDGTFSKKSITGRELQSSDGERQTANTVRFLTNMKGKIKFFKHTAVTGEPLFSITSPKWLRRKVGRYIRRSLKDFGFQMRRVKSEETIVGTVGENCTYYEGLSSLRAAVRVNWTEL